MEISVQATHHHIERLARFPTKMCAVWREMFRKLDAASDSLTQRLF